MTRIYKYRLNSEPSPRTDGFGIDHDMTGIYSNDDGQSWIVIPSAHRTIVIPTDELETVMDMPHATNPEKQAKNAAYKESLKNNRNTIPVPIVPPSPPDFTPEDFERWLDEWETYSAELSAAQVAAAFEAARANDYITNVLGQNYPVDFNL